MTPAEAPEHLENLVSLQDAEQSVQEYLESNGQRLTSVQHQGGDVEGDVWLDRLHRALAKDVSKPQLVQGWNKNVNKKATRN